MNPGKKILLFYPHNFFEMSSGTHQRVYQLITALWNKSFQVDLFPWKGSVISGPRAIASNIFTGHYVSFRGTKRSADGAGPGLERNEDYPT